MADAHTTDALMTVAAFLDWDPPEDGEKYELVDGVITAMGRERVSHNRVKIRAFNALSGAIDRAGVDCEVFIDGIAVSHAEYFVRLPDVLVHCGEIDPEAALSETPAVLVEVVSPTSAERDELIKVWEYFEIPSVAHYLIVLPSRSVLLHYFRSEDGLIATRLLKDGALTLDPPGLVLDVTDFFA